LAVGVDPEDIHWIMPREPWLQDRMNVQPGANFFNSTTGGYALQIEASALAGSVDELFARLERTGQLLRLDPAVTPTMYRCATFTVAELDQLRRIKGVVRMGRVRDLAVDTIKLEGGTIPTSAGVLHVDCTADGGEPRPEVPVFAGDRITLQPVRTCQQALSAAIIGHVEVAYSDESHKNTLCAVIPIPDSDIDWLRATLANTTNLMHGGPILKWPSGSQRHA
jgi:hypothetical protein